MELAAADVEASVASEALIDMAKSELVADEEEVIDESTRGAGHSVDSWSDDTPGAVLATVVEEETAESDECEWLDLGAKH